MRDLGLGAFGTGGPGAGAPTHGQATTVLPGTSFSSLPFSKDSNPCVLAAALSGALGMPLPSYGDSGFVPDGPPPSSVIPIIDVAAFRTAMLASGFPYNVMTSGAHDLVVEGRASTVASTYSAPLTASQRPPTDDTTSTMVVA